MDVFEKSRLVGDAVLLERAASVLERRAPDDEGDATRIDRETQIFNLRYRAKQWRREAEYG